MPYRYSEFLLHGFLLVILLGVYLGFFLYNLVFYFLPLFSRIFFEFFRYIFYILYYIFFGFYKLEENEEGDSIFFTRPEPYYSFENYEYQGFEEYYFGETMRERAEFVQQVSPKFFGLYYS